MANKSGVSLEYLTFESLAKTISLADEVTGSELTSELGLSRLHGTRHQLGTGVGLH